MSALPRSAGPALEPVREAIRRDAEERAREVVDAATRQAEDIRGRAREEADGIRSRSDADGRDAARTEAALRSARLRRRAGGIVLSQEEELREQLRSEVLAEMAQLRTDPRYPRLLDALRAQARTLLGRQAQLEEAPEGGIIGRLGSRSVNLSLPALADAALERHAGEVRTLWQD
ncbi:hypothetical protein [Arthrobacter caoxuetaonis]|uniref:hypothetical protein n=1 Tax=Arthrobacter caoxuetaonis TaxID=2886935 RepID=UPI001D1465B4|nr:hypothetical protein [Arthrobacter caoxuetaonis]MCC3283827.1 hypothetical protein [Arthrobacter caoxuetaonis]